MKHQEETGQLISSIPSVFDTSQAGTGKSLSILDAWAVRRRTGGGRMLVFAPKSCVKAVWVNEVEKFFPGEFVAGAALAPRRELGFQPFYPITIMNHDGVKWLMKLTPATLNKILIGYDTLIWDESDALRHNSARTKASLKLAKRPQWKHKACLSATPFNKSVTELFYQAVFLDGGRRLGKSFYSFRSAACDPLQVGPGVNHVQWVDKPDAPAAVAGLLQDISIRHQLEDVIEMPELIHRSISITLPTKLMRAYKTMRDSAVLQLKSDEVVCINSAVLAGRLLQLAAGSIYGEKKAHIISTSRYELAIELARESRPTVIFFNYKHQLEALQAEAKKTGLVHVFIDGSVSTDNRHKLVQGFQAGLYDVIFLQINAASHGITLTNARRVVFTTPPYSPSVYTQAVGRIFRKGQKHKCESILLVGKDTLEPNVVKTLINRGKSQASLLELLE